MLAVNRGHAEHNAADEHDVEEFSCSRVGLKNQIMEPALPRPQSPRLPIGLQGSWGLHSWRS